MTGRPGQRDPLPPIETVAWREGAVRLIDQRRLPGELAYLDCRTVLELWQAIRTLAVRGAPAIGVAAGYGAALAAWNSRARDSAGLIREVAEACRTLATSRPTAVNLFWALERMRLYAEANSALPPEALKERLLAEARTIHEEDLELSRRIGRAGLDLIRDGATVLTHCNAGALATGGLGTALAVVYAAHAAGRRVRVLADETRPLLQGSRLTAWELARAGIPVTVLCDGMAAAAMQQGRVDLVITGADRIAVNGDTANKIGTYGLAVNAHHHGVPFYVAAPFSTFDPATPDGSKIVIEERAADEVLAAAGWCNRNDRGQTPEVRRAAPEAVAVPGSGSLPAVWNPAFDVTPHELIAGLITDRGLLRPPYSESLYGAFRT